MVPTSQSGAPLSASLLLRVAEAADGFRDGQPHWFLVERKAPHKLTPFDSETAANSALKKAGAAKAVVLGPFVTGAAPAAATRKRAKAQKKVRAVHIYYEGSKKATVLDASRVDAIFLTESAREKFVYPYYSRVSGVAETARRSKRSLASDDPVSYHLPWTDIYP
ncbi:MAG: hypothetical protein ACREMA_11820 [Longimicrobiales bacterium]